MECRGVCLLAKGATTHRATKRNDTELHCKKKKTHRTNVCMVLGKYLAEDVWMALNCKSVIDNLFPSKTFVEQRP